jgi:hypothetical protein
MKTKNTLIENKNRVYDVLNELNEIHLIVDTSFNSVKDLDSIASQETLLLIEQMIVDSKKNLIRIKKNLQDIELSEDKIEPRFLIVLHSLVKLLINYSNILNKRSVIIFEFLIIKYKSLKYKYFLYKNKASITKIKKQIENIKFQLEDGLQNFEKDKATDKKFYFMEEDLKKGPFNLHELKTKNISEDTMILNESGNLWIKASQVEEIKNILEELKPPSLPKVKNEVTTDVDSEKIKNEKNEILTEILETKDSQSKNKILNKTLAYIITIIVCCFMFFFISSLIFSFDIIFLKDIDINPIIKFAITIFTLPYIWKASMNNFK